MYMFNSFSSVNMRGEGCQLGVLQYWGAVCFEIRRICTYKYTTLYIYINCWGFINPSGDVSIITPGCVRVFVRSSVRAYM